MTSQDEAQALTSAEQAIDENGLRDPADIGCHAEQVRELYGDDVANRAAEIMAELLPSRCGWNSCLHGKPSTKPGVCDHAPMPYLR